MPMFRWTRNAISFRQWPEDFSLEVGGVSFEGQKPPDGLHGGWPISIECDVESRDNDEARRAGHEMCDLAVDTATILVGCRIDPKAVVEVRCTSNTRPTPGSIHIYAPLIYDATTLSVADRAKILAQAAKAHLPVEGDETSKTVRHAIKWYGESVRESDLKDR